MLSDLIDKDSYCLKFVKLAFEWLVYR